MAIKITGLDELAKDLNDTTKGYKRDITVFLREEGKKLNKKIKNNAKSKINKKTGNFLAGIKTQKPYEYYKSEGKNTKDSVKVYGKIPPARHTHLIEQGHKKVLWGNRTEEFVKGFYIYEEAGEEYDNTFGRNAEEFINKCLSRLI